MSARCTAEIGGTVRDVVDPGDALTLSYGRTAGANIGSVRFETPVTPYDTRIGLYGAYNGAGVVSAAFSGLGITSVNRSAGLSVSQPLGTARRPSTGRRPSGPRP